MNITQESVSNFYVGVGGADAVARPIVDPGFTKKAYKGVRLRAATDNTVVIYVGRENVTTATGYPLQASEELAIAIEDPSKVYVIATPASNCQQTVTLSGDIPGDTFTLSFENATTDPIATTADDATVQAALEALDTIGAGNCTVSDTGGADPYTVEFIGELAKTDVELMVGTGFGVNETQTVAIDDATSSGTFTLSFDGQTTNPIDYDAPAQGTDSVQERLENLSNIDVGDVSVSGGPGPTTDWAVEFTGTLALTDVVALTGDGSSLVGGSTNVSVTETQQGDDGCTVTVQKVGDITADSQYSWISA